MSLRWLRAFGPGPIAGASDDAQRDRHCTASACGAYAGFLP